MILPQIPNALYVVNHSGGKDSQAMLIELAKVVPLSQMVVVHASLGEMEWEGAKELAESQAEALGIPFIVATAKKTLLEMVERRFETRPGVPSWPSASTRQCTSDLKRGPIQREVRRFAYANGYKVIINCMGLRAAESSSRAKRLEFRDNPTVSTSKLTWYEWLPIHKLSSAEVFKVIENAGQTPHWAYAEGNDRLSCVFCIMANKDDLKNGRRHRPELFEKYVAMEKRTGYTMHMNRIPLTVLTD
jgi:3'-phosphoadenosine 5'-phosphosulfate sulfotransferase (PAPS reductase)/FAD synthetase